jgi:hypothetical protein
LPGRVDRVCCLGPNELAIDGCRERGTQGRLDVQVGDEKHVTLVSAKLGQEFGFAHAASTIEDKELGLICVVSILEQPKLCLSVDEHSLLHKEIVLMII